MAVASNLKLLVFPRRKKNYMKKILIIIILIFLACKKEKVKESGFDYVHFTPLNSAFVKITDHSKYKIRLLTVIDGVEKEYPVGFYKEDFKEFLNILKDCEVLFFINFEPDLAGIIAITLFGTVYFSQYLNFFATWVSHSKIFFSLLPIITGIFLTIFTNSTKPLFSSEAD